MKELETLCRDRFERFAAAGNASKIKVIAIGDMAARYGSGELNPQIAAAKAA